MKSTDALLFSIAHVVSYTSSFVTLVPEDLVLSSISASVGHCMDPQVHLRDGNVVEAQIQHLASQRNLCVKEDGVTT